MSNTREKILAHQLHIAKTSGILSVENLGLSRLPDLPETLTHLNCSFNELTILPDLPKSLQVIQCQFNHLSSLPELPNNLTELYCQFNSLTVLPNMRNTQLQCFSCYQNKIQYISDIPTILCKMITANNPWNPTMSTILSTMNNGNGLREYYAIIRQKKRIYRNLVGILYSMRNCLPQDILYRIGSYHSNIRGTLFQQMATVKNDI